MSESGRFLVGERSEWCKVAGAPESGTSRDEADKGEEKGETDGLGVALRGVDVHPKWIEEGGGEVSLSPFPGAKPSSSESSQT